jgi:hypothetical protein
MVPVLIHQNLTKTMTLSPQLKSLKAIGIFLVEERGTGVFANVLCEPGRYI